MSRQKLEEMKCGECGSSFPEYFIDEEKIPLCKECLCVHFMQYNNYCVIEDLDEDDDTEVIEQLWKEQLCQHDQTEQ